MKLIDALHIVDNIPGFFFVAQELGVSLVVGRLPV